VLDLAQRDAVVCGALFSYFHAVVAQSNPLPPPLTRPKTGKADVEELLTRAVRIFCGTRGSVATVPRLILQSRLDWQDFPSARTVARELLLEELEGKNRHALLHLSFRPSLGLTSSAASERSSESKTTVLALTVLDLAERVRSEGRVQLGQLDQSKSEPAWIELPGGMETYLASFEENAADLSPADIATGCLCAAEVVVKPLARPDLPLTVKGPLFEHLQTAHPEVLGLVLARMTGSPHESVDALQVLSLLGSYGVFLTAELTKLLRDASRLALPVAEQLIRRPSGTDLSSENGECMKSMAMVRVYLEAELRQSLSEHRKSDDDRVRHFLFSELVGLYLEEIRGGRGEGDYRVCRQWMVDLVAYCSTEPCLRTLYGLMGLLSDVTRSRPYERFLDWEVVRLSVSARFGTPDLVGGSDISRERSRCLLLASRLVRLVALVELGRLTEAFDLLISMIMEQDARGGCSPVISH
jgi:hypothetical protein